MNNWSPDSDSGKTRVKDPDVFDSFNPQKLRTFLVSLSFVFLDHPSYFTEAQKINYTLSYLGGMAWEWFEPDIINPDPHNPLAWTYSFQALVKELQDNFGLYNAMSEAKDRIYYLKMKDSEPIWKYNTWFNMLAASTGWNVNALWWAYKHGIANHLSRFCFFT
ncbi:hypothetical protein GYMLUDRAFT_173911 [Collybiopsis luxurians FD-317 M1]|uniref:Retrotransposon gag domain-containing protein n=1 Tax=Collybiopsis luxurians FD-317 M1 TaxID=944289 RepID=A0A0D0B138_9AGAR|nr:hypothetical protein GYMLUDRAFT_173911 [Collybiopsis luxurians FD-317 M1]